MVIRFKNLCPRKDKKKTWTATSSVQETWRKDTEKGRNGQTFLKETEKSPIAKNGLTGCCDGYSFLRWSNESAGSSRIRTFSAQSSLVCDGRRPYINVQDCNDSST